MKPKGGVELLCLVGVRMWCVFSNEYAPYLTGLSLTDPELVFPGKLLLHLIFN